MTSLKTITAILLCWGALFAASPCSGEQKKILYVDSYPLESLRSAEITRGITRVLQKRPEIQLKIFRMNLQKSLSESDKKAAAAEALNQIESWKPDVVIASGDNAAEYLILPYSRKTGLPFVFCGIDRDASAYGFPTKQVTGMVERAFFEPAVKILRPLMQGDRIGILSSDTQTGQAHLEQLTQRLHPEPAVRFAPTFDRLRQDFLDLQDQCDMVLIQDCLAVKGFSHEAMRDLVTAHTRVPTLAMERSMAGYALITYAPVRQEQGEYAARTALDILGGRSPADIPVTGNKQVKLYLNMNLAKKLDIQFPMDLMEYAELVGTQPRKLVYVNSYHKGDAWSDGIENGLFKALGIPLGPEHPFDPSLSRIQIQVIRMDTKRNPGPAFAEKAARKAQALIEDWRPDIVVASDDNACRYLIAPCYRNRDLPVVFCGVNRDASAYGFPAPNITGMVEISFYRETIELLKTFARGDRLGLIGAEDPSNRKEADHLKQTAAIREQDIRLVSTYGEWKKQYLSLQESLDLLIWISHDSIQGWNSGEAERFILNHTRIVSGCVSETHVRFTLLGRVSIAEEQGWWAGKTALKILDGTSPGQIPVTANKHSKLFLNMKLARRMEIAFPMELVEMAGSILPDPEAVR